MTLETPTSRFYSSLGLCGTAIIPGFWNILSGLHLESILVCWASFSGSLGLQHKRASSCLCRSETMCLFFLLSPFYSLDAEASH